VRRVLILSPHPAVVRRIERSFELDAPDTERVVVDSVASARAASPGTFDVVIADFALPDGQATDLLPDAPDAHGVPEAAAPSFPLVLLLAEGDVPPPREDRTLIDTVVKTPGTLAALPHIARGAVREFAQLRRARVAEDRLRHANRLIGTGRLAAVLAHEVGTPLNVARMQAQLLAAEPGATDATRRASQTIIDQLDVISSRIRGMLDYARAGNPGRTAIGLHEAVDSAVDLLRPLARRKGVELELAIDDALVVDANRSQIQQVVFNLVANALHALRQGGRVEVRIARESADPTDWALVSVTDDGPGVPDAIRDQLFDAFVTTKPAGRGTGLGLSVCRDIAASHHGTLTLDAPDGRTRFTLRLPLDPRP
jgi:signal transduction histidine kinase